MSDYDLRCECGTTLPPGDGYREGASYICPACLRVWEINLLIEEGAVLVEHEPALT